MKEADLQKTVIDIAHRYGWRVAHFQPAQVRGGRWITPVGADGAGFPDLLLLREDKAIVVELKQTGKYPPPAQRRWLDAFSEAGVTPYLWRPADLDDGVVQRVLAR